ncbi:MAG: rod-binding protein [Nitrospirae bacterium]|nr:rod-binding protein [Nitrospirota bacterium]
MDGLNIELLKLNLQSPVTDHRSTVTGELDRSKSEVRKAAKDMEAMFVYQLIKEMRKTAEDISSEEKGLGNDTYMSLFDMEVSRALAERGFGLQDKIVEWLERNPNKAERERLKEESRGEALPRPNLK